MINKSPNVYVFIDGLDEGEDELFCTPVQPMNLYDRKTPDVIIKNLFSGRILSKAIKIVTSRPNSFLKLCPECRPKFSVRILGLSDKSRETFCRQLCGNNETYLKVKEKRDANPELRNLCHIPMYCKMITELLKQKSAMDSTHKVRLTSVFVQTFGRYFRETNSQGGFGDLNALKALTKLAFEGVKRNTFTFEATDLSDLNKTTSSTFFRSEVDSQCSLKAILLEGDKKFFFVHLLWQEFFAAVYLNFFTTDQEFDAVAARLTENRWNTVTKFSFGFQNKDTNGKLKRIFPEFNTNISQTKLSTFKQLISTPLDIGNSRPQFFWAFEADDVVFVQEAATLLPPEIVVTSSDPITTTSVLTYVLSNITTAKKQIWMERSIRPFKFHGEVFKMLMEVANSNGHKVSLYQD